MRIIIADLVSSNERALGGNRPVVVPGMEISVADTGALEVDKTLSGAEILGLPDGVVVLDEERGVRGGDDGRLLNERDVVFLRHG